MLLGGPLIVTISLSNRYGSAFRLVIYYREKVMYSSHQGAGTPTRGQAFGKQSLLWPTSHISEAGSGLSSRKPSTIQGAPRQGYQSPKDRRIKMAGLQNIKDQSPRIATLRPHQRLRHRGHAAHETFPKTLQLAASLTERSWLLSAFCCC